jgi:EmrB/QacA subfamily drug resistance transporter
MKPQRRTHRPAVVVSLLLSMFMSAMEMNVVSTAMPTVVSELGGALHYAWVFSAYMLALTVMTPIFGKLADLYGRLPVMTVAMGFFLVGSIGCGQADSMFALVAFRAVQGIGAGGLQPVSMTIIGDIFDIKERAKMQGVFGAVWGLAGMVGPMLGGLIVTHLSWRWVFYVNIPFGLVSAAILYVGLVEDVEKRTARLDLLGAIVLTTSVVALLLGIEGIAPVLLVTVAIAGAIAFLFIELRAAEPMLPPRLFMRREIATANALSGLCGCLVFGTTTFLPLYAQGVLSASPTAAGATIAPMAIGWPVASALSGRLIPRFGFRSLVRAGLVLVAAAGIALTLRPHATTTELKIFSATIGFGMGLSNTPLLIAVQTSVAFSARGVATASMMFFRSIGGTIAVGVMGVVLARTLLENPIVREAGGPDLVARLLSPERKTLDVHVLASIANDLAHGITRIEWILGGLAVSCAALAWLFPNHRPA